MAKQQPKRLYKSSTNKQIMGVAGGLAEFFNIDPTIIRVIFLILLFAGSSGFWLYIILGIVLPYDFQVNGTPDPTQHYYNRPRPSDDRKDVTPDQDENWDDF